MSEPALTVGTVLESLDAIQETVAGWGPLTNAQAGALLAKVNELDSLVHDIDTDNWLKNGSA